MHRKSAASIWPGGPRPSCARCRSWRIRAERWVRVQPRDPGHAGFDLDP